MSEYTVLNFDNDNNNTGKYPLFLGPSLGFADEINISYPQLDDIYKKQRSQFWLEDEISFETDRLDMLEAPESEKDVMVLNLLAQWGMDSMASRSIIETMGPLVTNTELHNWFLTQSFFEAIHAAAYSKIVRNCFADSNEMLERGKKNLMVVQRSKVIAQVFNNMQRATAKHILGETPEDINATILKTLVALYALEQIGFMASFASTFALVETGRYQGIGKAVGLILADEQLHAIGDELVMNIATSDQFEKEFWENKRDLQDILDSVVVQELDWAEYIFSEGRKVLGLNVELLRDYVRFVAYPCYQKLRLEWDESLLGSPVRKNPLTFMDKYYNRNMVQTANQEIQNNNYRVGQVEDDLGDEKFEFDI